MGNHLVFLIWVELELVRKMILWFYFGMPPSEDPQKERNDEYGRVNIYEDSAIFTSSSVVNLPNPILID